jgi:hypothetical protein
MIACQTGWERCWVSRDHVVFYWPEPLRSRETPMRYTVLTDDDVRRVLPMSAAVDRIESALREHAEGTGCPSRFRVDDKGVDIHGGRGHSPTRRLISGTKCFRIAMRSRTGGGGLRQRYRRLQGRHPCHLGAMRTGPLAASPSHMARPDASRAAILGSGRQARRTSRPLRCAPLRIGQVYSPNATNRE